MKTAARLLTLLVLASACQTATEPGPVPVLKQRFEGQFWVGAAVSLPVLARRDSLVRTHFNSLTAENAMKWKSLHPEPDRYIWEVADSLVAYAHQHGFRLRGHTLNWYQQTPEWVTRDQEGQLHSADSLMALMKEHIHTVVKRYKNDIYAWDVVNEAISDDDSLLFRPNDFYLIAGPTYIENAFRMAHEADPEALLFYNDYSTADPKKRERILELLQDLLNKGVPVHGMGMQGHWDLEQPSLQEIETSIDAYAALGLQVQITELDINCYAYTEQEPQQAEQPWNPTLDSLLAQRYDELFALLERKADKLSAVTFWGVDDSKTWLSNFPVKRRRNYPLLFDSLARPKAAFYRVVD
ncbi:MAG: endo-1,4-beta-xylanase [Cytophagales bacterium]|nr:endo-1,4-beta-xylanase [Cytophagales bacterium]